MSTSTTCPKCCRVVSLPVNGQPAAWVRCPLCRSEFRLQEAIDFVPPALEIIPEPEENKSAAANLGGTFSAATKVARPAADQAIPELLINPEREPLPAAEGVFVPPGSAPVARAGDMLEELKLSPELPSARPMPVGVRVGAGGSAADEPWNAPAARAAAPTPVTGRANRSTGSRRKQRNPLVELVKMVVGGVAGLAIGYAILLWVFKVDPFNLVKYLPATIVPDQLKTPEASGTSAVSHANGMAIARNRPPDPFEQPARMPAEASPIQNSPPVDHATTPTLPPLDAATPAEQETEPDGPKTDAMFSLADVSQAMGAASQAASTLAAARAATTDEGTNVAATGGAALNDLRKRYYVDLAKLAEAVTLLRNQNDDRQIARGSAAAFLLNAANDRAKLAELTKLAGAWIGATNRANNGIVLAGTVKQIEPLGEQFRTTIKLLEQDTEVPVISAERPDLTSDDLALVLGVLVQDPNRNLPHYSGSDRVVVWGGMIVKPAIASPGRQS